VFGINTAGASTIDDEPNGVVEHASQLAQKVASWPWYIWFALGIGTIGVCATAWTLFRKRIVPKGAGLHEVDRD
jgi:hypothetical protein